MAGYRVGEVLPLGKDIYQVSKKNLKEGDFIVCNNTGFKVRKILGEGLYTLEDVPIIIYGDFWKDTDYGVELPDDSWIPHVKSENVILRTYDGIFLGAGPIIRKDPMRVCMEKILCRECSQRIRCKNTDTQERVS